MAKSAWFRGPVCGTDNCRSRLYRSTDGLTICQFGHVLEGAVEFNDDQDQAIVSTRRINAAVTMDSRGSYASSQPLGMSQSQISTQRESERLFGNEAVVLYYRCLQLLLKHELNVFVGLFCSESTMKDLTCLVKKNWIDVLEKDVHDEETELKDMHIDTLDIIVIIYVSALQLRAYSIYTTDILENIFTNQIPYARTLHLIPKEMLDKLPTVFHNRLQPYALPTRNQIYKKIKNTLNRIMSKSEFVMPISFYFPLIFRTYSETLLLPNAPDLFLIMYKLLQKLDITQLEIKYKSKTQTYMQSIPEVYLSMLMIFITKLSFYNKTNNFSLRDWLTQLNNHPAGSDTNFVQDSNVLDWSDSKVENYCDWIYDCVIPKKHKLNEANQQKLTTLEKRLFSIFKLDNDDLSNSQQNGSKPSEANADLHDIVTKLASTASENLSNEDFTQLDETLFSIFSHFLGLDKDDLIRCYDTITNDLRKKTK
ncbi:uncharacterized protein SPAPADRAFT_151502 [Spathaspora passalidarum NRRL Y-27907]|uniref:Uncharacterized protein n=1 Tax=Spathaspora passalidarum (strain NRRL Y-27907 / 11-Y1) TaxID=619300 RepID=G3AMC5_SPAPN|nr:uncharacterized protein SPAPADRAFT_151502 [Spathaspora passalidarum NRRL Y-27907]EGW33423.1 hypothetical protein SPAPADRAFT_151502 [Spathaspora passalidarum NRRL Y-27907]